MTRRKQPGPEELLHRSVVKYLRWTKPNCVWWHTYNGAYMSKATAGKGKALGVLPGVADLVFVLDGGKVGFIELKAPGKSGKYLSAVQISFAHGVDDLGAPYYVARSIDDVKAALKKWHVTFAHDRGRAA